MRYTVTKVVVTTEHWRVEAVSRPEAVQQVSKLVHLGGSGGPMKLAVDREGHHVSRATVWTAVETPVPAAAVVLQGPDDEDEDEDEDDDDDDDEYEP